MNGFVYVTRQVTDLNAGIFFFFHLLGQGNRVQNADLRMSNILKFSLKHGNVKKYNNR